MLLLALLASMVLPCAAQGPEQDLPLVVDAAVPFYPPNARLAHIERVVRLQVSTNGETVSGIELADAVHVSVLCTSAAAAFLRAHRLDRAAAIDRRRLEMWQRWAQKLPDNPFVHRQIELTRTPAHLD